MPDSPVETLRLALRSQSRRPGTIPARSGCHHDHGAPLGHHGWHLRPDLRKRDILTSLAPALHLLDRIMVEAHFWSDLMSCSKIELAGGANDQTRRVLVVGNV